MIMQMALDLNEGDERKAATDVACPVERVVMHHVVIDRNGKPGEIVDKDGKYIVIRWSYGKYCFNSDRILRNVDGIFDLRVRR